MTTAGERTTADLLLEWDRNRPRSQQREFGMSELGVCQRRAGYRLAGVEPSNPGGSIQAVMGTCIHDGVESVLREMQAAGLIPADDLVEHEVRFAGILGHLDRYESDTGTLDDTKTTTQRRLDNIKIYGPPEPHLWQINGYAAALITLGYKVRRVAIDYLARDTGQQHRWTGKPDPKHIRDALNWVKRVRETPLEWLPRDYAPESPFCQHCPFLRTCWGERSDDRDLRAILYAEDPDAARWAQQLHDARAAKAEAKALEEEAKGALDALRPNDEGTAVVDVGWRLPLRWTVKKSNRLDTARVKADYAAAGAEPPTKPSRTVDLGFAPPVHADEEM